MSFQCNPNVCVRPHQFCSATFQMWEQLIQIIPLDPDHICPHQFISFQRMILFWLRMRRQRAFISPSAFYHLFQRAEHLYSGVTCCSLCLYEPGALMEGQLEKYGVQTVIFRCYSNRWELVSPHSVPLTYFILAARSSLTFS